ncbi:MAG: hypothetical protein R3C68_15310 [Myxococcota bacterium]
MPKRSLPPKAADNALYRFHRFLIIAAIIFGLVFAVWAVLTAEQYPLRYALAGVSSLASVLFAIYLWWFVGKVKAK